MRNFFLPVGVFAAGACAVTAALFDQTTFQWVFVGLGAILSVWIKKELDAS